MHTILEHASKNLGRCTQCGAHWSQNHDAHPMPLNVCQNQRNPVCFGHVNNFATKIFRISKQEVCTMTDACATYHRRDEEEHTQTLT